MRPARVVTTRAADDDIEQAVLHYLESGARDAALELVDALEGAMVVVADNPSIGSSRIGDELGIAGLRGFALPGHPFLAVYLSEGDSVQILRVLHTRRDIPAELGPLTRGTLDG